MTTPTLPRFIAAGTMVVGLASALTMPSEMTARQNTSYTPVTDQRLRNPEPSNWLMYRRTYNGWGYSPLDQITSQNVADLTPVWSFSTGVREGHQAPPIVNEGTMFVTTPSAQVFALDAKTGDLLWRYARELPDDLQQPHPTNRVSRCTTTRCMSGRSTRTSSPWTRPRARSYGNGPSRTMGSATTSPWRHWWRTAR